MPAGGLVPGRKNIMEQDLGNILSYYLDEESQNIVVYDKNRTTKELSTPSEVDEFFVAWSRYYVKTNGCDNLKFVACPECGRVILTALLAIEHRGMTCLCPHCKNISGYFNWNRITTLREMLTDVERRQIIADVEAEQTEITGKPYHVPKF